MMLRLSIALLLCAYSAQAQLQVGPIQVGTNSPFLGFITDAASNNVAYVRSNSAWAALTWTQLAGVPAGFADGTDDGIAIAIDSVPGVTNILSSDLLIWNTLTNGQAVLHFPALVNSEFMTWIVTAGPSLENVLNTTNIALLNRATNAFPGVITAGQVNTPVFSIGEVQTLTLVVTNSITLGGVTRTNWNPPVPLLTLAPATATNFTVNFSAGDHQVVIATNNVHLLDFSNFPATGFSKSIRLTVVPSGGVRTFSVRAGATGTNIFRPAATLVTNLMELEIRAMLLAGVTTNIAVFEALRDP